MLVTLLTIPNKSGILNWLENAYTNLRIPIELFYVIGINL